MNHTTHMIKIPLLNKEIEKPQYIIAGEISVTWNYKTGEVEDLIDFNLIFELINNKSFHITICAGDHPEAFEMLEKIIGMDPKELTEGLECEPPDGTQDRQDYNEMLDDFYPPLPRG